MSSIFIGIDYSIKNSSFCCTDFTTFKWGSIVSDYKFTKNKTRLLEELDSLSDTSIKICEETKPHFVTYSAEQRFKLDRYSKNITHFINLIKSNLNGKLPIVAIEGISFASKGNILIDLSISTGILRYKVLTELLNNDSSRLFIFSPGEMKNAMTCKGNADKFAIFNKFKVDPELDTVKKSELYKFIIENEDRINNGKLIESPINDLIDSYLGVLTLFKSIKNNIKNNG